MTHNISATPSDASQGLNPDDFLAFTQVAAGLPGVKPRVTLDWLKETWADAVVKDEPNVDIQGVLITTKTLGELFHSNSWGTGNRVSPAGAQLLITLYEQGTLPLKTNAVKQVSAELLDYANSGTQLAELEKSRLADKALYEEKLQNLQLIHESEFTYQLISDIFWKHLNKGAGGLYIGGILVTKNLVRYASNSGKSQDFSVSYSWVSSLGEHKRLTKDSTYSENRRNDASRNYGLPD
jgi:hypothetical protein